VLESADQKELYLVK